MKNNYKKYIKEVWKMKEKAFNDFEKSGYESYVKFIHDELSHLNKTKLKA